MRIREARIDDPSPNSASPVVRAMRPAAGAQHRPSIIAFVMMTAFVLASALPAEVQAESSLKLVLLDSADNAPNWGEQVTFDVTTSAAEPFVNLRCYQGEAFVYDGWAGFFDGAWFGQTFTLSSTYWQGGAADCKARLVKYGRNGRERELARLLFHVYA